MMTYREIDIVLRQINTRVHNDFAANAKMHGFNVPFINTGKPKTEKDKEMDKKAEAAMKRAMERKFGDNVRR